MTWTREDAAAAAAHGFGVFTLIDVTGGKVKAPVLQILPAGGFSTQFPTAAHILGYVRRLAVTEAVARKAIQYTSIAGAPPWGT